MTYKDLPVLQGIVDNNGIFGPSDEAIKSLMDSLPEGSGVIDRSLSKVRIVTPDSLEVNLEVAGCFAAAPFGMSPVAQSECRKHVLYMKKEPLWKKKVTKNLEEIKAHHARYHQESFSSNGEVSLVMGLYYLLPAGEYETGFKVEAKRGQPEDWGDSRYGGHFE